MGSAREENERERDKRGKGKEGKELEIKDNGQPPTTRLPPLRLSHIHTERPGSLSV